MLERMSGVHKLMSIVNSMSMELESKFFWFFPMNQSVRNVNNTLNT